MLTERLMSEYSPDSEVSETHERRRSVGSVGSGKTRVLRAIDDPALRRRLHDKARAFLGNDADAEECVQEALILAACHADRFEDRAAITTWLFSILLNCCRMYVRRVARHVGPRFEAMLVPPEVETEEPDPEDALIGAETQALVGKVLASSRGEDLDIFEQCVLGPMGVVEYSRARGLGVSRVKTRLLRLRKRIAAELSAS